VFVGVLEGTPLWILRDRQTYKLRKWAGSCLSRGHGLSFSGDENVGLAGEWLKW
jgi:hypothetical protein